MNQFNDNFNSFLCQPSAPCSTIDKLKYSNPILQISNLIPIQNFIDFIVQFLRVCLRLIFTGAFSTMFSFGSTFLILFSLSLVSIEAHGDHSGAEHDHDCACRAIELSFKIDCADTATMLNSLQTLRNNSCLTGTKCKTDAVCDKAFAIVLSHHDHCLAPPAEIANKTEVHAYEDVCTTCKIAKAFNPALPVCAPTQCNAPAATFTTAFAFLENSTNACSTNCSTTECTSSFRLLRGAYHRCDGATPALPDAVEKGVHGYDGACEEVDCNPLDKAGPPICSELTTKLATTGNSGTSAPASTTSTAVANNFMQSTSAIVFVALALML
jgi:hypothetical protein